MLIQTPALGKVFSASIFAQHLVSRALRTPPFDFANVLGCKQEKAHILWFLVEDHAYDHGFAGIYISVVQLMKVKVPDQ